MLHNVRIEESQEELFATGRCTAKLYGQGNVWLRRAHIEDVERAPYLRDKGAMADDTPMQDMTRARSPEASTLQVPSYYHHFVCSIELTLYSRVHTFRFTKDFRQNQTNWRTAVCSLS
jgi:hypothetical protein